MEFVQLHHLPAIDDPLDAVADDEDDDNDQADTGQPHLSRVLVTLPAWTLGTPPVLHQPGAESMSRIMSNIFDLDTV